MSALLAFSVGSALVSAYGTYKSGQAQADSTRSQAELNLLKAQEVRERNDINNALLMESALVFTGTQQAQLAGAGRTVESGRAQIADTISKASKQIERNDRAAEWEARMIEIGAQSQFEAADEISAASTISAIGTAGFGTARAFASAPGPEKASASTAGSNTGKTSIFTPGRQVITKDF